MRRARLRGLIEGPVQKVRAESTELHGRDAVERIQDYGFSAQPVEGQGLVISGGGHGGAADGPVERSATAGCL